MEIYIFGNGNLSFQDFMQYYAALLSKYLNNDEVFFLVCDFRGVDTLVMEFLKCSAKNVIVYHVGEHPRYLPDKYKTNVPHWNIVGGLVSDEARDFAAIQHCTHYLAFDFNSDKKRKSGTQKNIELCEEMGKINLAKEEI